MRSKGRLAVLLYKRKHAAPGVIAGVLPLLECAIEEAVRCALVNVHLVGDLGCLELPLEVAGGFRRGGGVVARNEQEQGSLHPGDLRLRPWRAGVETEGSVGGGVE